MQYIRLKTGDTFFPKSNRVPCNFECAQMPKIGTNTAVSIKPILTQNQLDPELYPNNGGNNKLPAPKKSENKAKLVIANALVLFIC